MQFNAERVLIMVQKMPRAAAAIGIRNGKWLFQFHDRNAGTGRFALMNAVERCAVYFLFTPYGSEAILNSDQLSD